MDKIKQFIISPGVGFFTHIYTDIYKLKCVNNGGYDDKAPCLFVGAYYPEDILRVRSHKGFKAFIFCGTDAHNNNVLEQLRLSEIDRYISISKWISNRLKNRGLDYVTANVATTNPNMWNAEPLGDKVYAYAPDNRVYRRYLIEEIQKEIPFKIILVTSVKDYSQRDLYEIYKQCFIGLRPTRWDGSSATVQELGLMGRKTVWNGDLPSAINFKDENDKDIIIEIADIIKKESRNIGKTNEDVRNEMLEALDFEARWLEV
jgi:hypothetical protein